MKTFAENLCVNATYRTGGNVYYRIISIIKDTIRVEEMNAAGGTGRYARYDHALFQRLFKNNCVWCNFTWDEGLGRYVDRGRGASISLRLDRYLIKQ
jgi:hypothetical protein